jgi:hypothetical protein
MKIASISVASCTGALLLLGALVLTAARSDALPGVGAEAKDLRAVVAAGWVHGPLMGYTPCSGSFNGGTCVVDGNTCRGLGQPVSDTPMACHGPNPITCDGAHTTYVTTTTSYYCCTVRLGTCQRVGSTCVTGAPYKYYWLGQVSMCALTDQPLPPEG